MRFINTETYELHDIGEQIVRDNPQYAILSHRWRDQEVVFNKYKPSQVRSSHPSPTQAVERSLNKIRNACRTARNRHQPLQWIWIDNVCIDKTNAVEESTSINSMFAWYRKSTMCITFLDDVDVWEEGRSRDKIFARVDTGSRLNSEWFERGWTLQELLAPRYMEFYDRNWSYVGNKEQLADPLASATRIDKPYLAGDFSSASAATRLSWMAGRTTTKVEDVAYSLLGVLGITMTPQYGEGTQAFMRLQRTWLEESADESIFAWTTPRDGLLKCYRDHTGTPERWSAQKWGLLAPSPDCFALPPQGTPIVILPEKVKQRISPGFRWTQQGMEFHAAMKGNSEFTNFFGQARSQAKLTLNCWRNDASGQKVSVRIELVKEGDRYIRVNCGTLSEKKGGKVEDNNSMGVNQILTRPVIVAQPAYRPSFA